MKIVLRNIKVSEVVEGYKDKGDEIVETMIRALMGFGIDDYASDQATAAIAALSAAGYAIVRQDKAVTVSGAASKEG